MNALERLGARGTRVALAGLVLLALAGCGSGSAPAPAAPTNATPVASRFGVLVMAHGGTPEWNAAVLETVAPLRARYPIEIAFGMADATTLDDAVKKLEAQNVQRIGVVRLFVSGESFTRETEQILGIRDGAPPRGAKSEPSHPAAGHAAGGHVAGGHAAGGHAMAGHAMAFYRVPTRASFSLSVEGLLDAPSMGKVLADRAARLSKSPAEEDVLVLAHGPGDDAENERWMAKLEARANEIRSRAPFRRVEVATLREDWPDKRGPATARIRSFVERARVEGGRAIVIPFRVQGFGPYAKVLEGLDYVSDGTGLIPHPEVTKWLEEQIATLERAR